MVLKRVARRFHPRPVGAEAESRSWLRRRGDQLTPFPQVPTAFHSDQLRAANEFLAAGNSLLVAMDDGAGRQMRVPMSGWTFRMATGVVRLAMRHRAEIIPCSIVDEGGWRFHVKLGRPVPTGCLAHEADLIRAGKHLLDELLPCFQNHPGQSSNQLLNCFQPVLQVEPVVNVREDLPIGGDFGNQYEQDDTAQHHELGPDAETAQHVVQPENEQEQKRNQRAKQ